MDIEARVTQLCNLLGKKFYSFGILAENDGLVNVKLGEEGIEAVKLLLLLKISIILSHTL